MKNSIPIPYAFSAPTLNKQKGAALILLVFALILVVLAYTVRALNSNDLQARENAKTFQALAEAKVALISWSVNHQSLPGMMPYPDRNGDGDYDGTSDCYASNVSFSYSFLLGELPIFDTQDTNCAATSRAGLGLDLRDGTGQRLWYAVSRNLVRDYHTPATDPVINPGVINNPSYLWMTVYDKNGQLISDKVAAVIIAPSAPLNGQDRSSGIAGAPDYLDTFNLQAGGGAKSNRTYSSADEDFYIGEDSRGVRSDNTTYQQPYYFNDKLVYITIDELMAEIEKRTAGEARKALQSYYTNSSATPSTRFFPYAAALGSPVNPNQCVRGNLQGLLPTSTASNYTCSCTNSRACTCNFGALSSVAFTRSSSSYGTTGTGAPAGACTVGGASNRTCTCTGLGSCKNTTGTVQFSCDACGSCTSTLAGSFLFASTAGFSARTGGCTTSGSNISCNGTTAGNFTLNSCTNPVIPTSASGLPTWFTTNGWQNYIYYAVSSNCTSLGANCTTATPQLTVGPRTGVRSLLISSGKPIIASPFASSKAAAQATRPSCDVKDYLDSTQNTNATLVNGSADLVYDATNTARSSSYNDQMFIVAP